MLQASVTPAFAPTYHLEAPERTGPRCSACNLRELCLPSGLAEDSEALADMVYPRRRVKRGEILYRAGDPFDTLFAIRSGFLRTRVPLENGRDQVTGFHMAGEMVGLDGIGNEVHVSEVAALEYGEVCAIPRSRLDEPGMQRQLGRAMSRELVRHKDMMLLLGSMRAAERLGAFLLDLSQRLAARGMSSGEFHLRMTREEIGSYLGLSLETVSRIFSRFHADRLIAVQQRHVRILDFAGLKAVSGGEAR